MTQLALLVQWVQHIEARAAGTEEHIEARAAGTEDTHIEASAAGTEEHIEARPLQWRNCNPRSTILLAVVVFMPFLSVHDSPPRGVHCTVLLLYG